MRTLRAGLSIFRIQLISGLQYRLSALAGSTTGIFWALIEVLVMTVFYTHAERYTAGLEAGLTLSQAISYIWLGQCMWILQPSNIDGTIRAQIASGDVGLELCRPLDICAHWFARLSAMRVAPLLLRGVPVLIAGLLMPAALRLSPPASWGGLLATLAALCGALALGSAFGVLAHALLLNIRWGEGPVNMLLICSMVLSGNYFPLMLWPDALQPLLRWQPFAGLLDLPIRLYLGLLPPDGLLSTLAMQTGWAAVFLLTGRLVMRRNIRRLVVQGG